MSAILQWREMVSTFYPERQHHRGVDVDAEADSCGLSSSSTKLRYAGAAHMKPMSTPPPRLPRTPWRARPALSLALTIPLILGLAGPSCTAQSATDARDSAADNDAIEDELHCGLVLRGVNTTAAERHLVDGDEVELLRGYQGYLLVQVRAHLWGAVPRAVQLRISGAKDGGAPLETVLPSRTPGDAPDSHRQTDPLEIWLSPPDPTAFDGHKGTLTLQAQGSGRSCASTVRVRFVDKTFCIHHDDGTVVCP